MNYILSIDQGTTSSRCIAFDEQLKASFTAQREFKQIFPNEGWVEHNPLEIWNTQLEVIQEVVNHCGVDNIVGFGITNQRETTIIWNRTTGIPIYNAIVWQDRRTSDYCSSLSANWKEKVQAKTGLIIDAYFSASKIKWILDHVEGARLLAENGDLCFGTVDTWLLWNLTKGKRFKTDTSNASRTMLFNIQTMEWDNDLLDLFDIPKSILPEVCDSNSSFGESQKELFNKPIPILAILGDQQAALFGQQCIQLGDIKCTYGTGCFMMSNLGSELMISDQSLLSTVAWTIDGKTDYALEGSVFVGGAVIQWLRDELNFFEKAAESESLAREVEDNGGVFFVPALSGLGAPYWDQFARGMIIGISRGTTKAHITRAALEAIALQVGDLYQCMEKASPAKEIVLKVDGGATENKLLMQIQADVIQQKICKNQEKESTALGAALMCIKNKQTLNLNYNHSEVWEAFVPVLSKTSADTMIKKWHNAVHRSQRWLLDISVEDD